MTRRLVRRIRRTLFAIIVLGLCGLSIWLVLPKPPLLDGISFSQSIRDRNGQLLRITLTSDQKFRIWTPLRKISPDLIGATLRYEDKYYDRHPGVNPLALLRGANSAVRSSTGRTGGSTITMQLARLRYGLHTRTVGGKLTQIVRAFELERHYSKDQILEAYLNLAPYGRNIEGIGAASQIYFQKPASRLSAPEAVALSVIPQSPSRRALVADRENRSARLAQNCWYDRAGSRASEFCSREFSARALSDKKFLAPHFVQHVLELVGTPSRDCGIRSAQRADPTEREKTSEINTTLDLAKQQLIERRITEYIVTNRSRGFENAAALLVDCRTMDVLAQIGSAEFFNKQISGQVDGTRSGRSPGSALKPFVYALALEQGLIHPFTVVADAPHSFGEYNPENFDREFLGPLRACDALARSRNVPAVALAANLSHPSLYEFLRNAEVRLPRPASFYGLALPLGGAEISMQDLVRLYAALANDGQIRPLRRTKTDSMTKGVRLLSPEASFLTLDMLGNVPRPELNWSADCGHDRVFWKTGTSHGFHDAWSVAVFDHYVVAVWIGNFDGRPNNAFVGRTAAGPLLFQIIDSLRANWPEPPQPSVPPSGANLKRVEFCAVSGELPEACCSQRIEGWFIPGVSPIKTCEVHHEIVVDNATGLRVANDDEKHGVHREVFEFWPSEMLALFERAGVPRRTAPPFLSGSDAETLARYGGPPRIISPNAVPGREIVLAATGAGSIPLRARADADVRQLYWFANKVFIGKSAPADVLSWKSRPGRYELTTLDDHGRSGSCMVTVR